MPEDIKQVVGEEQIKHALKEAMREWLDEQFAKFGRWSFYGMLSAGVVAMAYFILTMNGWHR